VLLYGGERFANGRCAANADRRGEPEGADWVGLKDFLDHNASAAMSIRGGPLGSRAMSHVF
jgi:hypothetical protein